MVCELRCCAARGCAAHLAAAAGNHRSCAEGCQEGIEARIILGQAEMDISEKFTQAALTYQNDLVALHLCAMNMLTKP